MNETLYLLLSVICRISPTARHTSYLFSTVAESGVKHSRRVVCISNPVYGPEIGIRFFPHFTVVVARFVLK